MTNLTQKLITAASVLGAVVLLAGCTTNCPNKGPHHTKKYAYQAQPVEVIESDTIVVYQTHEDADVKHLYAKMYTHSSDGGASRMGHIKFRETDKGLKMEVDLKDLRPAVPYNVRLYQCGHCYNDAKCCGADRMMNVKLPMLETGESRHLKQTYIIQGLNAAQIDGANIYLERDGGYKAGWGKLEK
ncbi:MAG: hypothetical protein R8N24_04440 [Alphaproteobacteria bacterium]|nr:hypothetical protein [Alphaproteobacteria bacterium]